jgi:REP element-mobilizing transposase RayT
MSLHSYSRIWLHLVWGTLERRPFLKAPAGAKLSKFLTDYAKEKSVYMKINFVNSDHVHAIVDLPTKLSVEDLMQLLKGASSHWINENQVIPEKFAWGRGYGGFSVSQSGLDEVAAYVAGQEEHHRKKTFGEEFKALVERYGLEWIDDASGGKPLKRLEEQPRTLCTPLKRGVNEIGRSGAVGGGMRLD